MQIENTKINDLKIIHPKVIRDDRGWFCESYNQEKYSQLGIDTVFVQDNHSQSARLTLRGLHFQTTPGQAKLIRCTQGEIWDVAVDIRAESPTLGQWHGLVLSAENQQQLFIPVGFAHGFLVLSEYAEVQYKCSNVYVAATESGIAWDDAEIGVAWPIPKGEVPLLSKRDQGNQSFKELIQGRRGN